MSNDNSQNKKDEILILLATDIHLGVYEDDPVRYNDSFVTFEEILQQAVKYQVDFILLGGDLFHHNKPSINCLNQTLELLRKYCLGPKPISVEILNETNDILNHPLVNYLDPNLNVSIPIFTINGNHDDPSGLNQKGALDLLSAPGFVNYFGKWSDLTHVNIYPICLRKGETHLGLYGISHIKDERFARLFLQAEVTFFKPDKHQDKWFNLFVLHQNRVNRPDMKYIREEFIPDFMDFVFWGHEHECKIPPEKNEKNGFVVLQLGSPVATSVCPGEAVKKHIALLKIIGKNSYLTPIPLETVRPMVLKTVSSKEFEDELDTIIEDELNLNLRNIAREQLKKLAEEAKQLLTDHPSQPTLPTLRLTIDFESPRDNLFNPSRFGQELREMVANPNDCLRFRNKPKIKEYVNLDGEAIKGVLEKNFQDEIKIENLLSNYFSNVAKAENNLSIFSCDKLNDALIQFVDKEENNSFDEYLGKFTKKLEEKLLESELIKKSQIEQQVIENAALLHPLDLKELMVKSSSYSSNMFSLPSSSALKTTKVKSPSPERNDDSDVELIDSDEEKGRGKGKGRGRGSRGGKGSRGGRGKNDGSPPSRRRKGRSTVTSKFFKD